MAKEEDLKIRIQHTLEADCTLVGVLHRVASDPHGQNLASQTGKIALILHGYLGHKDYLFQKRLAYQLPMDSFRFDFRGNHESNGSWALSGLAADVEDISVVVSYLKATYGYQVELVVAHSRASISAMKWISTTPEGKTVPGFVNISGRKRMGWTKNLTPEQRMTATTPDPYTTTSQVAGKKVTYKIHPHDMDIWTSWDTSYVRTDFPSKCDVLTIHGLSDQIVPPYDAIMYAKAFSSRGEERSGTHVLHFIEEADHNFVGHHEEVIGTILEWWRIKQRGTLRDGLWGAGLPERGKL